MLLAIGGTAVWVNYMSSVDKDEPVAVTPIEDVENGVQEFIANNDVEGGLEYFDEQIEARSDENEKKSLLLSKARFAQRAGWHNEALDAAKQANQLDSDIATNQALAEANETVGNKEEAIAHYKEMIEMVNASGDEMAISYAMLWEAKIRELEQ